MKKSAQKILIVSSLMLVSACSQMGETTGYAAATGGLIGAGIGAIVGNQVGNPGAGLALGMAAGAGTGAAIGNMVEGNERKIAANEERINRQEETIRAQRNEMASLRNINQDADVPSYKASADFGKHADLNSNVRFATPQEIAAKKAGLNKPAPVSYASAAASTSSAPGSTFSGANYYEAPSGNVEPSGSKVESAFIEKSLPTTVIDASGKQTEAVLPSTNNHVAAINNAIDSSQCENANSEIQKADRVSESSDKLFHIRRALRLCPSNAVAHAKLGETYLAMNRNDDARLEFQEALKLDPSLESAQAGLESMQRGTAQAKLPANNRY